MSFLFSVRNDLAEPPGLILSAREARRERLRSDMRRRRAAASVRALLSAEGRRPGPHP